MKIMLSRPGSPPAVYPIDNDPKQGKKKLFIWLTVNYTRVENTYLYMVKIFTKIPKSSGNHDPGTACEVSEGFVP